MKKKLKSEGKLIREFLFQMSRGIADQKVNAKAMVKSAEMLARAYNKAMAQRVKSKKTKLAKTEPVDFKAKAVVELAKPKSLAN